VMGAPSPKPPSARGTEIFSFQVYRSWPQTPQASSRTYLNVAIMVPLSKSKVVLYSDNFYSQKIVDALMPT
jgi:hypothetical protein